MATKTLHIKRKKKIVLAPKSLTAVNEESAALAVPADAYISGGGMQAVGDRVSGVILEGLQTSHFFDACLAESQKLKAPPVTEKTAPRAPAREVLGAATFKFFCYRCGQKLQVPVAWSNKMHTCRSCGHDILIPPPLMGDLW
jgi:DNA-directed RNA polymerase subunit RPC12/RpoP